MGAFLTRSPTQTSHGIVPRILWLDQRNNLDENQIVYKELQRHVSKELVHLVSSEDDAVAQLQKHSKNYWVIITSGHGAKNFILRLHLKREVQFYYRMCVYAKNTEYHKNWANMGNRVSLLTDEPQDVIEFCTSNPVQADFTNLVHGYYALELFGASTAALMVDTKAQKSHANTQYSDKTIISPLLPHFHNENFVTDTLISGGSFGAVYVAHLYGELIAAKTFHILQNPELYGVQDLVTIHKVVEEINKEILALVNLTHERIIQYKGVVYSMVHLPSVEYECPMYILMEYADGGTLEKIIHSSEKVEVVKWILQIAQAVEFIHSKKAIHRDLKPANIFLKGGNISVGDFGLSKLTECFDKKFSHLSTVGTPCYAAPEISSGNYTYNVDCYSLGVILVEMLLRKHTVYEHGSRQQQITEAVALAPQYSPLLQHTVCHEDQRWDSKEIVMFLSKIDNA